MPAKPRPTAFDHFWSFLGHICAENRLIPLLDYSGSLMIDGVTPKILASARDAIVFRKFDPAGLIRSRVGRRVGACASFTSWPFC